MPNYEHLHKEEAEMSTENQLLRRALTSVADYIFQTNDQGMYYHSGDIFLNGLANQVNEALDGGEDE